MPEGVSLRKMDDFGDVVSDLRARVAELERLVVARTAGRIIQCTSSTRPATGLYSGLVIFETDTQRFLVWDAAASSWNRASVAALAGSTTFTALKTTNQAITANTLTTPAWDTVTAADGGFSGGVFTVPAGFGGLWVFALNGTYTTTVATTNSLNRILINGSARDVATNLQPAGSGYSLVVDRLTAGATVQGQVLTFVAATLASGSFFTGVRIGPG